MKSKQTADLLIVFTRYPEPGTTKTRLAKALGDEYINNYRIYDDRVGETTRFTYHPDHEWYWFPQQKPNEVSMLKCYDSVTDGSVSRWSFHTACKDPTAPAGAPCRKNVVVRSFVFF